MRSHLFIDRSACKCTPEGDGDCKILVIRSSSGEKFEVLDHSIRHGSQYAIKDWNLAIFRGPSRSSELDDPSIVKQMSCEMLQLAFRTADERKDFSEALQVARGEYVEAMAEYVKYRDKLRRDGDRPRGSSNNVYGSPSSSTVSALAGTTGSYRLASETPPRLASIAKFSELSLGSQWDNKDDT